MICQKCFLDFPEKDIQVSHDVPRYLFIERNEADKFGRHNLCKKCHDIYERILFSVLIKSMPRHIVEPLKNIAKNFALNYFKGGKNDTTKTSN